MWIFTKYGFFSLTQSNVEIGLMQFRARLKTDLQALIATTGVEAEIIETPANDYRWRILVEPQMAVGLMIQLTTGIDYSNFKDAVFRQPGQASKSVPYHRVWSIMAGMQREDIDDGMNPAFPAFEGIKVEDVDPLSNPREERPEPNGRKRLRTTAKAVQKKGGRK